MKKFKVTYTENDVIGKEETIKAMSLKEALTKFLLDHLEAIDWTIEEI